MPSGGGAPGGGSGGAPSDGSGGSPGGQAPADTATGQAPGSFDTAPQGWPDGPGADTGSFDSASPGWPGDTSADTGGAVSVDPDAADTDATPADAEPADTDAAPAGDDTDGDALDPAGGGGSFDPFDTAARGWPGGDRRCPASTRGSCRSRLPMTSSIYQANHGSPGSAARVNAEIVFKHVVTWLLRLPPPPSPQAGGDRAALVTVGPRGYRACLQGDIVDITVISGTNREGSKTLEAASLVAARLSSLGAAVKLLDLRLLPPEVLHPGAYDQKPPGFRPFADAVLRADGLFVVTPEYNGGMPGALKLFIDMLPFPTSFERRPVAFLGVSAGRWGALRPVEQLQGVFGYRNAFVYPERLFLHGIGDELGPDGLRTPLLRELFDAQTAGFLAFCEALAPLAANARLAAKENA